MTLLPRRPVLLPLLAASALLLAAPGVAQSPSPGASGPTDAWSTAVCTAHARIEETRGPLVALGQSALAGDLDGVALAAITAGLLGDQALRALEAVDGTWVPGGALNSLVTATAFALVDLGLALAEVTPDDADGMRTALGSAIAAQDGLARAREEAALLREETGFDCTAVPVASAAPLPGASSEPEPTGALEPGADPELEARFPDQVAGVPVEPVSRTGLELVEASDPDDIRVREVLEDLGAFLAADGRSFEDLTLAFAFVPVDDVIVSITAYRVQGADASTLEAGLLPLITYSYADVRTERVTIEGRELTRISQGPYDPAGIFEVLVPSGDTLWAISAVDATLAELVAAFPG